MRGLTDIDLRFLVETVATQRSDYDQLVELLRDKDDLIEPMLDDPRLLERLRRDAEALVRISPTLLFTVLLRAVRRELDHRPYVYEIGPQRERLPVFEAPDVVELLDHPEVRSYLVKLLCSFIRTQTGVLYWREQGHWHHRKFSDLDLDDMITLARLVERSVRPHIYRRIGDVALFLTGIYPDHTAPFIARRPSRRAASRSLPDYERDGQRFYERAANEPALKGLHPVFEILSRKFTLARRALNTLTDGYLKTLRPPCLFGRTEPEDPVMP